VTSALWSPLKKSLTISGRVVVGGGKTPPSGTQVTIGDVSVANLKTVTGFNSTGNWTTTIILDPLTVPCAIHASVNAAPSVLTAQKDVTGFKKGTLCIK